MRYCSRILLLIVAWSTAVSSVAGADDFGNVELIRDRWGTPHVFAATDEGAMYGLGYAAAEDRGFQMHYMLRIMQGRLAEVVGDIGKARRRETALQNDRKMRTFGFYRAAQRIAPRLDKGSIALLEAYCRGVNGYFGENRNKLHEVFGEVGLVPEPWTPADCIVSWWHLAQFFATDGTRDLIGYRNLISGGRPGSRAVPSRGAPQRGASQRGGRPGASPLRRPADQIGLKQLPPDESTAVVQREDVTDDWLESAHAFLRKHGLEANTAEEADPAPKFSHAWVVDGEKSGTGSAVLVSEPRTPVSNPSLFYEFHIRGKTFDARGVGVAGSPIILIGFNRNVAWGMTALGADQADLFRLKTDPNRPNQYEVDGQWHEMEIVREQIRVKDGRTVPLQIRQTRFGPVVNEFAFARPDDPLVALKRVPICEPDRETIQGAMGMIRAKDVGQFMAALEGWRFPSANVVVGDRAGAIGFSLIGALPLRSPLAPNGGRAAHDGSTAKADWLAIVPQTLVPHLVSPDKGYIFSANHRPIGAFYPIPLGIRTGSLGDTLRSWRLREMLAAAELLSPAALRRMHADTVNPARREIVRIGLHLRDVLERDLSPAAQRALRHLEAWHRQGSPSRLDIEGSETAGKLNTFFRMMATDLALVYGGGESGLSYFLKTVGQRIDKDPKAHIAAMEQEFIDRALADAWESCRRAYGPDPKVWNERARAEVRRRTLPYQQSLDGFPSVDPSLDLTVPALSCVDGGTIHSQSADAYSQWVPLDDVDAAMSILPIGSSERPDDPMRTVNYQTWAKDRLHPAPLSREAVDRLADSKRVLKP